MRNNSKSNPRKFETCVTVHAEECNGNAERMVRRFSKKVKNEGILEEARDRAHFTKPSIIAAARKKATKRLIRNVNRKREELCTPRDRVIRRRR